MCNIYKFIVNNNNLYIKKRKNIIYLRMTMININNLRSVIFKSNLNLFRKCTTNNNNNYILLL